MKKSAVLILSLVYLLTTTGATVHFHYCMGKLSDWGLVHKESKKCDNCGMAKKDGKGCCKDEHKFIKNSSDQQSTENIFQVTHFFAAELPSFYLAEQVPVYSSLTVEYPVTNAPLGSSQPPVYLFKRTFLI